MNRGEPKRVLIVFSKDTIVGGAVKTRTMATWRYFSRLPTYVSPSSPYGAYFTRIGNGFSMGGEKIEVLVVDHVGGRALCQGAGYCVL